MMVDLRSKCIFAKWRTFSSSRVAGKEYTTEQTVEESWWGMETSQRGREGGADRHTGMNRRGGGGGGGGLQTNI